MAPTTHATPLTASDERPHELTEDCWCGPTAEHVPASETDRMAFYGDLGTYWSILAWMKRCGNTNALANEVRFMTPIMVFPGPVGYECARPGDMIVRDGQNFRVQPAAPRRIDITWTDDGRVTAHTHATLDGSDDPS